MYDVESVKRKLEELEREKERIIEEFKRLEEKRRGGVVSEEEYREERYKLERRAVEVMDRIAQLRFMAGYV
jgi:chromosome segregation ATPase